MAKKDKFAKLKLFGYIQCGSTATHEEELVLETTQTQI